MFRAGGKSTAITAGTRKKVLTSFPDGSELVEEYDITTGELLLRKRRERAVLSGDAKWDYLFGEEAQTWTPQTGTLKENTANPLFLRKDTKQNFQWRIRNLPYPKDVYNLTINHDEQVLVVRTTNKKYFKKISVPELKVLHLSLNEQSLHWSHDNNTLIVSYLKPQELLEAEAKERKQLRELQADSESECKQQ